MGIFYTETYQYETKINPDTILNKFENMGAAVYDNKFEFIGIAGSLNGIVDKEKGKTILFIRLGMSSGVKLFYSLWLILTGFSFVYSTYLCIKNWDFNFLPLISLGFLVIGLFFMTFIGINQAASIKIDIMKALQIKRK